MRFFEGSIYLLSLALLAQGSPAIDQHVVGGGQATPNEHTSIVIISANRSTLCTGSIINREWVLTAASCVQGATYIFIGAGEHDLQNQNHGTEQVSNSTTYILHHDWVASNGKQPNLALVKLNQPFTFNEYVQPATLARAEPDVGSMVTAAGWGKRLDALPFPSMVLFEAEMPVDTDAAAAAFYADKQLDFGHLVCTDTSAGDSSCGEADLGGPLYNTNRYLVGVTALYPTNSTGHSMCQQGHPACYTPISMYRDWICSIDQIGLSGCTDEPDTPPTTTTTPATTSTQAPPTGGTSTPSTSSPAPPTTQPGGGNGSESNRSFVALVVMMLAAKMIL